MKKVYGLVIAILFIALVLFSGCLEKSEEAESGETPQAQIEIGEPEEKTEVKSSCDDDNICTIDTFNELTNDCEYETKDNCCGNELCEDGERCNEDTHVTDCIEDCGRTCPAFLIVHKEDGATESDIFAMSCGDDNCQKTDENAFTITDDSSITTTISNIGEKSSAKVMSTFICGAGTKQAIADGKNIYGVIFEDHFNEDQNELPYINPIQSVSSSATYYLTFDTENQEQPFTANCKLYIKTTTGFEDEQNFNLYFP